MRFKSYSFLLLLLPLFFACTGKQSKEELLSKQWNFVSIKDSTGKPVKSVNPTDTLKISGAANRNTFSYSIKKENINATGNWTFKDSVLSFTYDLKPLLTDIDSTVYEVIDKRPVLIYFKNGKEIARNSAEGLASEKVTRQYKISKLTQTELVLEEKGITYSFSFTPKIQESALSFNSIWRGLVGIIVLTLILYLLSTNKKAISWKLVGGGLLFQIIFAIAVLKIPFVQNVFEAISGFFVVILQFSWEGSRFVFNNLLDVNSFGFIFAFQILPTIIFFSALTSLFFYLGILQKIVYGLAWLMGKAMKISGAENLSTAANIFLGQTEAPLMIKPYIATMTKSEMLCIMVGGMANTAGGVLAAYVGFLGGDDPVQQLFFAKHLLAASVMSAPATIVVAKMMMPQTEPINEKVEVSKDKLGSNMLEAIANGTTDGLKLAVNVAAMLIVFIALIAMVNYLMQNVIGDLTGLNTWVQNFSHGQYKGFTLQFILGYACAPLVWLLGVCKEDMIYLGQLLGEKTILNEFIAYKSLGFMKEGNLLFENKSMIMATYILSGFANFASIGIQIGGIGALAPNKKGVLSQLGIKALIGGTIASLFTATIVGMLI